MTIAQYRRWLQTEIRWLQREEGNDEGHDQQDGHDAASILGEARRRASGIGLPEVAKLLRCASPAVGPVAAQNCLAAALAALPNDKLLSVPQVAKRYSVSPETVRRWIASGELRATNIANKGKRPRHRIAPDALAEFDAKRGPAPQPTKRRPRKQDLIVTRY